MKLISCQLCGARKLNLIIDLGLHPLADSFLPEAQVSEPTKLYPLQVMKCSDCGHSQLGYSVPEQERYQAIDYSYTASNSPVSVKHFGEMASEIASLLSLSSKDLVVDIGSNDGTLLRHFKTQTGAQVIGIEPSKNISAIARKNGIKTIQDFFNDASARQILKTGKAKAITATNVFNHITDLKRFMRRITKVLHPDGLFVFEVPYFPDLIRKGAFDTIYLEHISYFSVKPFKKFFEAQGLYIARLETNEYMGGSVRVYLTKNKTKKCKDTEAYITKEQEYGIYTLPLYKDFMSRILNFKIDLCKKIYNAKAQGKRIIGIGAATKGNTLLNYCKIDSTVLDFVTDGSPLKIGKYLPGSRILIRPDSDISSEVDYALILPWNIADFLVKKLSHHRMEFIIPSMK